MKRTKNNILGFLLFTASGLLAQDFHLSLYDAAPLFLNPAMTGLIDGKFRAHAHYRTQWNAAAYKPFTTALVSFDVPKGKWGFGGQVTNMRAGIGNYNVFQALGSVAYAVPLDKERYNNLSFGLQGGLTQKRIEYQVFSFDNQWTTRDGGSFDRSLANNENFNSQVQFQEAVNFGMLYYYAKQQSRLNPFIGLSAFNLTQPRESFLGGNNRLPIRYFGHAGVRVNIGELLYIIPKVLIYHQAGLTQQTYAADLGYYFRNEKFYALAGYVFRAGDANIAYVGFRKDNTMLKLGYDFNTSSLRGTTKTRGAFEIGITWMGRKPQVQEIKNCPRL